MKRHFVDLAGVGFPPSLPKRESYEKVSKKSPINFHLEMDELKPMVPKGWEIKLFKVDNDEKKLTIVFKIMSKEKKIIAFRITNQHKYIKRWDMVIEGDVTEKNESTVVDMNHFAREVLNYVVEKHPKQLQLIIGAVETLGHGNFYYTDEDLRNYEKPLQIQKVDYDEIEKMVLEEYQSEKDNYFSLWRIPYTSGEKSKKVMDFLESTGYFHITDEKVHFNKNLDSKLTHNTELKNKLIKWLKKKGILL